MFLFTEKKSHARCKNTQLCCPIPPPKTMGLSDRHKPRYGILIHQCAMHTHSAFLLVGPHRPAVDTRSCFFSLEVLHLFDLVTEFNTHSIGANVQQCSKCRALSYIWYFYGIKPNTTPTQHCSFTVRKSTWEKSADGPYQLLTDQRYAFCRMDLYPHVLFPLTSSQLHACPAILPQAAVVLRSFGFCTAKLSPKVITQWRHYRRAQGEHSGCRRSNVGFQITGPHLRALSVEDKSTLFAWISPADNKQHNASGRHNSNRGVPAAETLARFVFLTQDVVKRTMTWTHCPQHSPLLWGKIETGPLSEGFWDHPSCVSVI